MSASLRRLAAVVAALAVLLHGGALVRHNGAMLAALLEHAALSADLTAICRSGAPTDPGQLPDQPAPPKPVGMQDGCPICSGQAAACATLSADLYEVALVATAAVGWSEPRLLPIPHDELPWPPARGPPARSAYL